MGLDLSLIICYDKYEMSKKRGGVNMQYTVILCDKRMKKQSVYLKADSLTEAVKEAKRVSRKDTVIKAYPVQNYI